MSALKRHALLAVSSVGTLVVLFTLRWETGLTVALQRFVLFGSLLVSAVTFALATTTDGVAVPVESRRTAVVFWSVFWSLGVLAMGLLGDGEPSRAGAVFDGVVGAAVLWGLVGIGLAGIGLRVAAGDPPGSRTLEAYRDGKREPSDER